MRFNFDLLIFTIYFILPSLADNDSNILLVILDVLRKGQAQNILEQKDENVQLLSEYDFIVVGAGTAGCVLAARLSENPNWKVLLLEAGGPEKIDMDIPIVAHFLQLSNQLNWNYYTEPSDQYCLGMENNNCRFPRGKVMGGCSVLNYMMYTRGNRLDYDEWAQLGNEGWSYKDVLPYFQKLEGSSVPDADPEYVGRHGPVKITYPQTHTRLAEAFVNAVQEDGLPYRDYNGARQIGVSYIQTTTDGQFRWSSNRAYLYSIKGRRPNLHISKHSFVTKILVDPETKTAHSVRFEKFQQTFEVRARMEVICAAGAVNTPQLLMLSGIGPAKHLKELGIKTFADLAVGFNLQDHISPFLTFLVNETSLKVEQFFDTETFLNLPRQRSIMSIPGGVEAISFYALDGPADPDARPDMELYMLGGSLDANPAVVKGFGLKENIYKSIYSDVISSNLNAYLIGPMVLRPRSRGRVMLRSKNPKEHPRIYPNYLRDPYDMDLAVRGLQKSIELSNQPSLRRINATLLNRPIPACRKYGDVTSRAYLECYIRHFTLTVYHMSGTAKMGPKSDRTAVVDARLRVYGISNLRVVDASIMPNIVSGHTNGPVYMIAEKASDMIKQDYGFV